MTTCHSNSLVAKRAKTDFIDMLDRLVFEGRMNMAVCTQGGHLSRVLERSGNDYDNSGLGSFFQLRITVCSLIEQWKET